MISSARRIASALLFISVLSFGITYVASGVSLCKVAGSCAAAVSLSGIDLSAPHLAAPDNTANTTDSALPASPEGTTLLPLGIELTAAYVFAVALVMLIVTEFYEPKYVRKFVRRHGFSG